MRRKPRAKEPKSRWKKSRLEDLIGRAIEDAQDEDEQHMGFFAALEDHVKFPYKTAWAGRQVTVRGIEVDEDDEIVAVCVYHKERESVPLLDLPIPKPPPPGAEWIEAYRLWLVEGEDSSGGLSRRNDA